MMRVSLKTIQSVTFVGTLALSVVNSVVNAKVDQAKMKKLEEKIYKDVVKKFEK